MLDTNLANSSREKKSVATEEKSQNALEIMIEIN